ncbi:hypothetical protein V8G54_022123 [Vigna mungo]|uniref:Serine/threonine-protein kinase RIO1 n=1 Tax=Vigna mungo TaxID=3915 RepID=A0AAQ3RWF5_VIGMU
MENDVEKKINNHTEQQQYQQDEIEEEDEEVSSYLDSEIGHALDLLDSKNEDEGHSFPLNSRRPNSHGGHHHYSSTLQPRTNRNQKYYHRIRTSPLEGDWPKEKKRTLASCVHGEKPVADKEREGRAMERDYVKKLGRESEKSSCESLGLCGSHYVLYASNWGRIIERIGEVILEVWVEVAASRENAGALFWVEGTRMGPTSLFCVPSIWTSLNLKLCGEWCFLEFCVEWEGKMNVGMSNYVITAILGSVRESAIGKSKTRDKADRATVEQAIDPNTRKILYKMLINDVFDAINGCISTGKEANVYHATKSDGEELAVKIYRTSVLEFKDRDRYVQGDFRFRNGYSKHNPRKMVQKWAEKEMRNLMRLKAAGIRCPTTSCDQRRLHVLVMEFIGKSGWAAPRLKDAALSSNKLREGYVEIIIAMRTLYQKCKLVHGDLSEYNILYYEGHLYIIDVSQAVEHGHPHALDFLREDCVHVSDFFKKHGVAVMTIRELFDFIVDETIADDAVDSYLEEMQRKILARGDASVEDEIADSVFVQSFIPKTLDNVKNAEEDVQQITSLKDTNDLYYLTITGHKHAQSLARSSQQKTQQQKSSATKDSPIISDDDDKVQSDEDQDGKSEAVDPADKKAARKEARKDNKRKVKEEKREARKTKVPKAVQKRKKNWARSRKTR